MLKVLSYILFDLDPKVKIIGQKAGICDGVPSASALVPFNLIFQHYIVLKKLNFDLSTPSVRGKGGSAGKIFATMLLHS